MGQHAVADDSGCPKCLLFIGLRVLLQDRIIEMQLLNDTNANLATEAAACIAASERAPCVHCACLFAEQWGDAPWHCFKCKKPLDGGRWLGRGRRWWWRRRALRAAPETAAKAAVEAVDAPLMSGGELNAEGQRQHAARGVTVGYLVELGAKLPAGITTVEVVESVIKPQTASCRCRYVELPEMQKHIGTPRAFVSHTWKAPFADLVAAIAYVLGKQECVWLDVCSVRQWPGNRADLDFRARSNSSHPSLRIPHLHTHPTTPRALSHGPCAAQSAPSLRRRASSSWASMCQRSRHSSGRT